MKKDKTDFSLLSKKDREKAIKYIIDYFAMERDEKIGVIAAENLLDMFLNDIGPQIYNNGLKKSKKVIKNHIQEIDFDIEMLIKEK